MNILIVKTSSLGDIIHAFPVLEYLKEIYPACSIDWVVEESLSELVKSHPLVNDTLTISSKQWRSSPLKKTTWQAIRSFCKNMQKKKYDFVFDLQGNIKSGIVTALAKSDQKIGFGYQAVPELPNLLATHRHFTPPCGQNIREDYLFLAQKAIGDSKSIQLNRCSLLTLNDEEKQRLSIIPKKSEQKQILICPGSNWKNKMLSFETLSDFTHHLSDKINPLFLYSWGSVQEKDECERLASRQPHHSIVLPKVSLPLLQNLMAQVDLVIAMDSLPLHLAGMTHTPTYSVFGPSSALKYKPKGVNHYSFQGSCPYGKTFEKRCELLRTCKTGACMKQLKGDQLFEHFYRWWTSIEYS